jgi:hypothetical protein
MSPPDHLPFRVQRERFLVLAAALSVACGGANAPGAPVAPPVTPAATAVEIPPPAASGSESGARTATPVASASAEAPAKSYPEVEVDSWVVGESDGLPGPACEEALDIPKPGHEEARPRVRLGAVTVAGRVGSEEVTRTIAKQGRAAFGRCVEIAKTMATKEPRVGVHIRLREDGSSFAPEEEETAENLRDPLFACARSALLGLRYPKPDSGAATVVVPLTFHQTTFVPDRDKLQAWADKINKPCKKKRPKP